MTAFPDSFWRDKTLSLEAKAIVVYLHRPPGAEIRLMEVRETLRVGADRMKRITRELLAAGYVKRTDRRSSARSFYTLVGLCGAGGAEKP